MIRARRFRRLTRPCSLALLATTLVRAPSAVAAEEKAACVDSAERAQRLRSAGKLVAARRDLEACASPACPAVVRADCQVWLREVDELLPSLALGVLDQEGRPLDDVRVTIDGEARPYRANGEPLALDPGAHWLELSAPGHARIKEFVTLAAGDRQRPLVIKLPAPAAAVAAPATAPTAPPEASAGHTTAWIVGGVVAAGVITFGVLGATGAAKAHDLRSSCAPGCDEAEVSAVRRRLVLADVSLAAALLTGGLWLAFGGRF